MAETKITKKAYAKINLGLDVLRKREDGYHEVKMIMQTVGICDELIFEKTQDDQIRIESDTEKLPLDEKNLIYKAARIFFEETGQAFGVTVYLKKRIPIAAGMAGGSADAAATFLALNEMAKTPLSERQLQQIALKAGADVPYCIIGGTALSEGIGEILTPLKRAPKTTLLIAKPDIDVSTAFVYRNLHADTLKEHPDIDGMRQAIEEGSLSGITDRMGNVLETVTIPIYPVIGELKKACMEAGAVNALMSGSGPTVFAIFEEEKKAVRAAEMIKEGYALDEVYVTEFVL